MARSVIGWPLGRFYSIYGGLTFGGGPVGNCMTHAVAVLTHRLREGSRSGRIFGNGGFATRNHAIVLTHDPPAIPRGAESYDVQARVDERRGSIPLLVAEHVGPGRIERYSVPHRNALPAGATIVARTPECTRFLASVPGHDGASLGWLTNGVREPVGAVSYGVMTQEGLVGWRSAV